jgi:hypothetical protein
VRADRLTPKQPGGLLLDIFELVTEVIDFRSFSNLWYWIVLAVLWSTLSQWVLGIPHLMVQRANRGHEESQRDMDTLVRINVRRLLAIVDVSGVFMVAFTAFLLTVLAVLGWGYRMEFCQALFLLLAPALMVGWLSVMTARKLKATDFEDVGLRLRNHRLIVQGIGVVFIFLTAFWGMYTNVTVSPLL